jgi:hypothetical protein
VERIDGQRSLCAFLMSTYLHSCKKNNREPYFLTLPRRTDSMQLPKISVSSFRYSEKVNRHVRIWYSTTYATWLLFQRCRVF